MTGLKRPATVLAAFLLLSSFAQGTDAGIFALICAVPAALAALIIATKGKRRQALFAFLVAIVLAYPPIYGAFAEKHAEKGFIELCNPDDGNVVFTATVDSVTRYGDGTTIYADVLDDGKPAFGVVLNVSELSSYPEKYDRINFSATLHPISDNIAEKMSLFASTAYYRAKGCYYAANTSDIEVLGRPSPDERNITEKYYYYISDGLKNVMPVIGETDSFAYVTALLTGDRTYLTDDISDIYERSGLIPFLCISGLHVVIASAMLKSFSKKLRFPSVLQNTLLFVFLFFLVIVTGYSGSVIRASVMSAAVLSGDILGRKNDRYSAISVSLIVLLLMCPYSIFVPGTQLSYLAMLGILCAEKIGHTYISEKGFAYQIKNSLTVGFFAVGFSMTPIIALYGNAYLFSPVSSAVAGLIFTPIMYLVVLLGIFAPLPNTIKLLFAIPASALLRLFEFVARVFAFLDGAAVRIPSDVLPDIAQIISVVFIILLSCHIASCAVTKDLFIIITGTVTAIMPFVTVFAVHIITLLL